MLFYPDDLFVSGYNGQIMTAATDSSSLLSLQCTVFDGLRRLASGTLEEVVGSAKQAFDDGGTVLIVDDESADVVDVDYSGTAADVLRRLAGQPLLARRWQATDPGPQAAPRGRGRPRLGVVAREVTLLPRHWAWLSSQPGGASVALRRLVDEARRANAGKDVVRQSQEAAYRFMSALAGNLPGFEEATRALFAGDRPGFDACVKGWPDDVRAYAGRLAGPALDAACGTPAGPEAGSGEAVAPGEAAPPANWWL
jgi:uncharacterized protein